MKKNFIALFVKALSLCTCSVFVLLVGCYFHLDPQSIGDLKEVRLLVPPYLIPSCIIGAFLYTFVIYCTYSRWISNIYSTENLKTKRIEIITLFENKNYILESETETSMTFRHRNRFIRLINIYPVNFVLDYSDIPATLWGDDHNIRLSFAAAIEELMDGESATEPTRS